MQLQQMLFLLTAAILQECHCLQPFTFTFSDNQMFYDLSTYNFAKGRTEVYEYTLTARNAHQVRLYLFQNNVNQYSINVYDGLNDQADKINVQDKIPQNHDIFERPEQITSSGKNMFIRIKADTTDLKASVDFQAFATDYAQPADCYPMVMSMNMNPSSVTSAQLAANHEKTCYYIIHANDPTNNPLSTQYVKSSEKDINSFNIYKGLVMDNIHLLEQNSVSTWASDKYITIRPSKSIPVTIRWNFLDSLNMDSTLSPSAHGQIMTNDFLQDPYPKMRDLLEQTFILQLPITMNSIQIAYVNFMGSGSLTVTAYLNKKVVYNNLFLSPLSRRNATYSCDMIQFKYVTAERNLNTGSGVYLLYDDATDSTIPPTEQTVLTTTKDAAKIYYLLTLLFCLLTIYN